MRATRSRLPRAGEHRRYGTAGPRRLPSRPHLRSRPRHPLGAIPSPTSSQAVTRLLARRTRREAADTASAQHARCPHPTKGTVACAGAGSSGGAAAVLLLLPPPPPPPLLLLLLPASARPGLCHQTAAVYAAAHRRAMMLCACSHTTVAAVPATFAPRDEADTCGAAGALSFQHSRELHCAAYRCPSPSSSARLELELKLYAKQRECMGANVGATTMRVGTHVSRPPTPPATPAHSTRAMTTRVPSALAPSLPPPPVSASEHRGGAARGGGGEIVRPCQCGRPRAVLPVPRPGAVLNLGSPHCHLCSNRLLGTTITRTPPTSSTLLVPDAS